MDIDVSQGGVISCPLDTTSITSFLQLASAFVSKPVGDTGRHTSPHPQQGGAHALEDPDPVGPTRGTMRWLENLCRLPHPPNTTHTDADSEDGIDYDKLNALLAKVHLQACGYNVASISIIVCVLYDCIVPGSP